MKNENWKICNLRLEMRDQILNCVKLFLAPDALWLVARFVHHSGSILIVKLIDNFYLIRLFEGSNLIFAPTVGTLNKRL